MASDYILFFEVTTKARIQCKHGYWSNIENRIHCQGAQKSKAAFLSEDAISHSHLV